MIRPIRLLSAFLTVGAWTMASRVLGFLRDILIAAFLGAGVAAEAFFVAFALPNMFRRLFAEGAFNTAFLPMYAKRLETGDDADGFASDAFSALAALLIGLTLLATLAMPALVFAMAAGFWGDARFDLAVTFGRICFPYILFISLAALLSGALNAGGRFAAAAAAPVLLNIILVAFMAGAWRLGWDVANALVWAVPLAGIAQLVLLWIAAKRAGIALRLRLPRLTPELRQLARIALPAALAGGVVQINMLVGRQVASGYDGAVAWLAMADRLYQLPLGLVGVAIGVVLLPDLSRKLAAADTSGAREAFNRANEFALALTLPAAVALIAIPTALVGTLFERGAFTGADTVATAQAVAIYGLGLPAFVLQKTVMPVYFARGDTSTPFRFAVIAMIINAVIAIGLMPVLGYLAAALATTVSSWVLLILLWRGARGFGEAVALDSRLQRAVPRLGLAALIMGAGVLGANWLMSDWLAMGGWRYLALGALVAIGAAVYAAATLVLGAIRPKNLAAALGR